MEHPPNIEFYRNTLEKEENGTVRPTMFDLVEGDKQQQPQQQRRESGKAVEMFRVIRSKRGEGKTNENENGK